MRFASIAALAALSLVSALPAFCTDLTWRLDVQDAGLTPHQFTYHRTGPSGARGAVVWDPCWYFKLPAGGVEAAQVHYLEVRLYSSAPADLLDVYYQAPNGEWGLLGRHPVRRGWATYRMDLATLTTHESSGTATSRRWGGAEKRVVSFRIDPGNEGDRWVALSHARLTDQPLPDGVTEEPRASMAAPRVQAPVKIASGDAIRVTATVRTSAGLPATYTAYVRLMRGAMVIADHEERIDTRRSPATVTAAFATSKYLSSGRLTVRAGTYELDGPGSAQSEAGLQVRNHREGVAKPPRVGVRRVGGDPTIVVNGKPVPGMAFLVGTGRHVPLHAEFARAGIHLYTDWFGTSTAASLGHTAEGRYDYGEFDAYFADILDADPGAQFIPHLYVTPPEWWQRKHPAEMCRYSDGAVDRQSFASEKWRADIGANLRKLIAHLQSSSYADRILGYILCSGHTAEWQQWGIWGDQLADYSGPQRLGFARWLQQKGRPNADGRIPTPAERASSAAFVLRDPTTERRVIDYYQYASETIASAIVHFAKIVKQASGGRSLACAYYGYLTQHGPHQQDSGHLALEKLLDAPEIDFVMSPPMYTGRESGGTSTFMSADASVKLHGKLWLNESDIRTSLSDPGSGFGRAATLDQSRAVLVREFGAMLARRAAISWFDMDGGWFSHPRILSDMAAMRRLAGQSLASRKPFRSEIAVFISAESAYRMKPSDLWVPAVLTPIVELPRVGAPADVYLLSDVNRPDFPQYKVYVFLNAVYVDAQTRRSIELKVKRRGATAVWAFAPGAVTDAGVSAVSMSELTGLRIAIDMREAVQEVRTDFPTPDLVGWNRPYGPVFWADDPEAEVLGRLSGSGKAGLVRKRLNGWTSIYFSGVGMSPPILRKIARQAGAHVYLDTNDALDTDGEWICVHARAAGQKTLRLPRASRIVNAMTGKVLAAGAKSVTLTMQAGETVLLRVANLTTWQSGRPCARRVGRRPQAQAGKPFRTS